MSIRLGRALAAEANDWHAARKNGAVPRAWDRCVCVSVCVNS